MYLHVYENIHLQTHATQSTGYWAKRCLTQLDECVRLLENEDIKWYEFRSSWIEEVNIRYMTINKCIKMHFFTDRNIWNPDNHRQLRIRRLNIISKLKPQGEEYFNIWITYWIDLVHNLERNSLDAEEPRLLSMCEFKFRNSERTTQKCHTGSFSLSQRPRSRLTRFVHVLP